MEVFICAFILYAGREDWYPIKQKRIVDHLEPRRIAVVQMLKTLKKQLTKGDSHDILTSVIRKQKLSASHPAAQSCTGQ